MTTQKNNPLHGITLQALLSELVDHYGWHKLAQHIDINCFKTDPSIKSSLKFLRKTPWARAKVESLYLSYKSEQTAATAVKPSVSANAAKATAHPPGFQASIWGHKSAE